MSKIGFGCLLSMSLFLAVVWPAPAAAQEKDAHASHAESVKAGHDTAADHGGGHESGVPLNFKTDLALWSLIVFIVFVAVLKKFAWGPLSVALNQREGSIRQNIDDAEAARFKAEKLLAAHEERLAKVEDEVRQILANARSDAEKTKNEIVAAAQKEADASRQRAVADIERARDQALTELFEHLANTVTEATENVIGRSFKDADNQRLIQEVVTGFNQRRT